MQGKCRASARQVQEANPACVALPSMRSVCSLHCRGRPLRGGQPRGLALTARGTACRCGPAGARRSRSTSGGRAAPPACPGHRGRARDLVTDMARAQVGSGLALWKNCTAEPIRLPRRWQRRRPADTAHGAAFNTALRNTPTRPPARRAQQPPTAVHLTMASSSSGVQGPLCTSGFSTFCQRCRH